MKTYEKIEPLAHLKKVKVIFKFELEELGLLGQEEIFLERACSSSSCGKKSDTFD
jgi:hypothetical protein